MNRGCAHLMNHYFLPGNPANKRSMANFYHFVQKKFRVSLCECYTIISDFVLGAYAPSLLVLEKRVRRESGAENTAPAALSSPAKPNSHTHTHKNTATHRKWKI